MIEVGIGVNVHQHLKLVDTISFGTTYIGCSKKDHCAFEERLVLEERPSQVGGLTPDDTVKESRDLLLQEIIFSIIRE